MNMQSCIGKSSINGGAMTSVLIQIVKKNPTITYGKLLDSIHEDIEKANKEGCLPGILKRMLNNFLSQVSSLIYIYLSSILHKKCFHEHGKQRETTCK
jgi:hypothetical protein